LQALAHWRGDILIPNLTHFQVADLSCPNSKLIFILESPHNQELKAGYPAAGDTGVNMSKILFALDEPLGKLLKNESELPVSLSLINCSRIPLQKSCYGGTKLGDKLDSFLAIHDIHDSSLLNLKTKVKEKLRTEIGSKAVKSFRIRLLDNIAMSRGAKLIVCGVIAQCFFEETTLLQCRFRKPMKVTWESYSFSVYYEFHPSSQSGQWNDASSMVGLQSYVS